MPAINNMQNNGDHVSPDVFDLFIRVLCSRLVLAAEAGVVYSFVLRWLKDAFVGAHWSVPLGLGILAWVLLFGAVCFPFARYRLALKVSFVGAVVHVAVSTILANVIHQYSFEYWLGWGLGLVIAVLLLWVAGFGLLSLMVYVRRRYYPLFPEGCCTKCGYDLRGSTNPRCPECGTPFESTLDPNNPPSA